MADRKKAEPGAAPATGATQGGDAMAGRKPADKATPKDAARKVSQPERPGAKAKSEAQTAAGSEAQPAQASRETKVSASGDGKSAPPAEQGASGVAGAGPAQTSGPVGKDAAATAGHAPAPVVTDRDRVARNGAEDPGDKAAKAAGAASAYRPAQPRSDWSPQKDAAQGEASRAGTSPLRALGLGALGGAAAALLVSWAMAPAATPGKPSQGDGKIATALEELDKERTAGASRTSAAGNVASDLAAPDLAARIAALEEKVAAGAQPDDAVTRRLKAVEDKMAGFESAANARASAPSHASSGQAETVAALDRRLNALEQRLAAATPRVVDPSVSRGPERLAPPPPPPPPQAMAPWRDDGPDGLRPPAPIPEPPATPPPVPVRGWVLHNVTGGVAVLEGRSEGLVEARRGQNVPGLGRIISIDRRGSIWVVGTERGVITAPAY